MSDQTQFENTSEQFAPPHSISPAPLSGTLGGMLAQRVRVVSEGEVHWMSGYDALLRVLREKTAGGDAHASALLVQLEKYAGPISRQAPGIPSKIAAETPAERELSAALVRRMLARHRETADA